MINHRSNCRIGKIGCYHIHIALYRLSSRVGDKRTRTADIRHRDSCGSGGSSYRRTGNGELSPFSDIRLRQSWTIGNLI
ncbi:hypothetical protein Pint_18366 [Pistacia integerrima]|uniref:Uncharacterized protein n=1 Tax=Pistacia integerrima TaxID=434235 RepID=A0ACC0YYL1_9ROSI|nr:hypothetical protein Pint_18366 [Pistacia integerrima]